MGILELDMLTNRGKLKTDLIFCSLFIMIYENFVATWEEEALYFYANGFTPSEMNEVICTFSKPSSKNGKLEFVPDTEAEKKFKDTVFRTVKNKDGRPIRTLSLFNWMMTMNMIDNNDYNTLCRIFTLRNKYAHELFECIGMEYLKKNEIYLMN